MILRKSKSYDTFEENLRSIIEDIDYQLDKDILLTCISNRLENSLRLYDKDTDYSLSNLYIRGSRKVMRASARKVRKERNNGNK